MCLQYPMKHKIILPSKTIKKLLPAKDAPSPLSYHYVFETNKYIFRDKLAPQIFLHYIEKGPAILPDLLIMCKIKELKASYCSFIILIYVLFQFNHIFSGKLAIIKKPCRLAGIENTIYKSVRLIRI